MLIFLKQLVADVGLLQRHWKSILNILELTRIIGHSRGRDKMKVKKEVRELCQKFRKAEIGSKEFNETKEILLKKYKFTPFNLLALFQIPPTIEFTKENMSLVLEQ